MVVPLSALRARHERARDDVDDADRLARRARRADDRGLARRRPDGTTRTRARRPTTTPTTCSCASIECVQGERPGRARSASRCSTTGARRRVDGGRRRARARSTRPTARRPCGCSSDLRMGIEGNRVRARHTMREGEKRFCALSWSRRPRRPADVERGARGASRAPLTTGASWLAGGPLPRPPLARVTCSARRSC